MNKRGDPVPIPKISEKKDQKTFSYISKYEKQSLLRILMQRGHSFEESKERVGQLANQLKETRDAVRKGTMSESRAELLRNKIMEDFSRF